MLLSTSQAAKTLEISANSFRRIAKKKGLRAASIYRNPHYRPGPPCPLWDKQDVLRLQNDEEVIKSRELSEQYRIRDQLAKCRKRYCRFKLKCGEKKAALKDVCDAMFSLNLYAKHYRCTARQRKEIYALKTSLLRRFCAEGLIDCMAIHTKRIPERICFRCDGSCFSINGDHCNWCSGTGYYSESYEIEFVLFSLKVENQRYSWHQPRQQVIWNLPFHAIPKNTARAPSEFKPEELSKRKYTEAKELIQYYLK